MALAAISFWFTLKERPQLLTNTILFDRAEVATSVKGFAINCELFSAESKLNM